MVLFRTELEEKVKDLKHNLESCSSAKQPSRMDAEESDPLDSFMADVADRIDSDKVMNAYANCLGDAGFR